MTEINLGDEVKDIITGLKGIVIGKTKWMYGCNRVIIQPPMDKDGKVPDGYSVDEPQVEVIKPKKIKANKAQVAKSPAGPKPTPARTVNAS